MYQTAPPTAPADGSRQTPVLLDAPLTAAPSALGSIAAPSRRSDPTRAPLSIGQENHWLFQQLFPDNAVLNTFKTWRPAGPLDLGILELALTEIVRRHEVLRTNFRVVDGAPVQMIRPPEPVTVDAVDLGDVAPSDRKSDLVRWLRQRTARPFDLAEDVLFRADLVRLSDDDHIVLFTLHHIICDGWSLAVLVQETSALYEAFTKGGPSPLDDLALQYGDYSAWQRARLKGPAIERQLAFWRARLADVPDGLALPFDRPRPPERSFRGAQTSFTLGAALVARLRRLCASEQATLFMLMIATWATLLHRYSGETDIVIGSPMANRGHPTIEPLIGLFMNTVAFRFDLSGDPPFATCLGRARAAALDVFDNQDVAFESVLSALGVRRETNSSPLFQVMFVMQPAGEASVFTAFGVDAAELTARGSKFDLTLAMGEGEDGDVSGLIEYATDLFDPPTIDRLVGHFVALVEAIAADPHQRLSALTMLSADEKAQLVEGWNATAMPYPEVGLHDLVAAQAERTPGAVALRSATGSLDYRTLEQRANQLARHLRARGVGADTVVGLCLRRSCAQIVALLAILKAGGAYLPLDPNYPPDRLALMLADAKPGVVVTEAALAGLLRPGRVPMVLIDTEWSRIAGQSMTAPHSVTRPDDLAYVLYTSGSTGRPKGVMGTHRALVNRLHWDVPRRGPDEVYIQKTTLGFIDAVWDIFMPLIRGQSTIVVPDEIAADPAQLVDLMAREGATRIVVVPSLLRAILDTPVDLARTLKTLRHWTCSGEALSCALATSFQARLPEADLYNVYGASEFWDATWSPAREADGSAGVSIGAPIANMRALVLGSGLEPVPINAIGELFIAGAGLARGYVGRPGLTAERFLPDPFGGGGRIYRTGDLVRRRSDGRLEFIGRRDGQIKLRGHRIEVSEIERVLLAHPNVRVAVVQRQEDLPSGEPGLVAYLIADGPKPGDPVLREHLLASLPGHMIPAHFVVLTELPMTPSGKIDRAALPRPTPQPDLARVQAAPRSDLQQVLAAIWTAVLGIGTIGIDDNFFERGGSSMSLVRVQTLIKERIDRDIPIVVLFRYPTIRALASYLVEGHRDDILMSSTKRGEARQKFLTRRTRAEVRPSE